MKAKIVLIRHGMTQGNQEHRYVGTTDEGLAFGFTEIQGQRKKYKMKKMQNTIEERSDSKRVGKYASKS